MGETNVQIYLFGKEVEKFSGLLAEQIKLWLSAFLCSVVWEDHHPVCLIGSRELLNKVFPWKQCLA